MCSASLVFSKGLIAYSIPLPDSTSTPVYVYPHSKHVLMQAVSMDTQFLADNAVIDYSLLTCVDRVSGEVVVGIIGEYETTLREY